MYCGDEVAAVVADFGWSTVRFGYAGDDTPRALFPGEVGRLVDGGSGAGPKVWALSDAEMARARRGLATRRAVGVDGRWADWEALEQLWTRGLGWLHAGLPGKAAAAGRGASEAASEETSSADGPRNMVMVAESPWSDSSDRVRMAELMMEKFGAPALHIAPSPVLASFAAGRSTSIVVDCGGGGTSVVPVVDGLCLHRPAVRSMRGGDWLSAQVRAHVEALDSRARALPSRLLPAATGAATGLKRSADGAPAPSSLAVHPSYEFRCRREVAEWLKADMCGMPLLNLSNHDLSQHLPLNDRPDSFELPDGTSVKLTPDLFRIPERLFRDEPTNPPAAGSASSAGSAGGALGKSLGLQRVVRDCAVACDVDARKELLGNVLLTGGGSQFKYFPERLTKELNFALNGADFSAAASTPQAATKALAAFGKGQLKARVVCPEPIERRYGVWIGGSILASLGSAQQLWLSKAQYDELGAARAEAQFFGNN